MYSASTGSSGGRCLPLGCFDGHTLWMDVALMEGAVLVEVSIIEVSNFGLRLEDGHGGSTSHNVGLLWGDVREMGHSGVRLAGHGGVRPTAGRGSRALKPEVVRENTEQMSLDKCKAKDKCL